MLSAHPTPALCLQPTQEFEAFFFFPKQPPIATFQILSLVLTTCNQKQFSNIQFDFISD